MMKNIQQTLTGALLSALITGAGCWLVFGADKISREEMEEYVREQAPWVRERGLITASIEQNGKSVAKIERAVEKILAAQQQLIVEQRVLVTKVDELLEK
jgi:hypothetical protein